MTAKREGAPTTESRTQEGRRTADAGEGAGDEGAQKGRLRGTEPIKNEAQGTAVLKKARAIDPLQTGTGWRLVQGFPAPRLGTPDNKYAQHYCTR